MLSLGDDHFRNNIQVCVIILGFRVHSSQTRCYVLLFCTFSNCIENTVKKSRRVSTYIIDYQGLNSSVIITTYIVVVVKFYQGNRT